MPDPKQKKTLPNLGNKNASMGMDGKMTIISAKMKKNYKPMPEKKPMKYIDPKTGKDVEKYPAAPQMGHSPAEMGHSPAEMSPFKGHCGPMKMESNNREKYNLEHDNPVAKHASWMSKFSGNSRMSPMNMGHSPLEKKVKVNYKGKELTLDDRSQEYKSIMKPKENKQVKTEAVMDRFGTNYTGLKKS